MPRHPRDFDGTGGHSGVHLSLWGYVFGSISLAGLCMGHVRNHSSLTQLCPGELAHPKAAPSPALCYNSSVQHNDDLKQPPSLAQVPVSGQIGQY